jgi:MFS family permease
MNMTWLQLLVQRRFAAFFWTQALGAFNDNLLKNILILLVTYEGARFNHPNPGAVAGLASALFTLPFVLLAGLSGQLADRYPKRLILRLVKLSELGIMLLAWWGLVHSSLPLLLLALFGMGVHSTFFSPAKYGVLPELLSAEELAIGNGLLEAGTFLAILLGTMAGLVLTETHEDTVIATALLGVAGLGIITSRFIPTTPLHQADLRVDFNPWTSLRENIRLAKATPSVWCAIIGVSWFWAIGIVILAQIPVYVHDVLKQDQRVVSVLLGGFTLGIGAGSLLGALTRTARLDTRNSRLGLVGLSLTLASFVLLGLASPWTQSLTTTGQALTVGILTLAVLAIGIMGGLFVVPLYTCINIETPAQIRSRVVSANSFINFLWMIIASLATSALLGAGLSTNGLFWVLTLCNLLMTPWFFAWQRKSWEAAK